MPYMMKSKSKFSFLPQSVSFTQAGSNMAGNRQNLFFIVNCSGIIMSIQVFLVILRYLGLNKMCIFVYI